MSKHRMEDGSVVDTDKASKSWEEDSYHDGHNFISKATGSQWEHETLYRSRKGRYYTTHCSAYHQGRQSVEWVSPEEAVRWLLTNGHELPEDLQELEDSIVE